MLSAGQCSLQRAPFWASPGCPVSLGSGLCTWVSLLCFVEQVGSSHLQLRTPGNSDTLPLLHTFHKCDHFIKDFLFTEEVTEKIMDVQDPTLISRVQTMSLTVIKMLEYVALIACVFCARLCKRKLAIPMGTMASETSCRVYKDVPLNSVPVEAYSYQGGFFLLLPSTPFPSFSAFVCFF